MFEGGEEDKNKDQKFFHFDMNMGQLLTLLGIMASILGGYYSFDRRLTYLESAFEKQLTRQTDLLEASVRHDEKLRNIAEQIGDIKSQVRTMGQQQPLILNRK